jgi:hypothetical protein
MNACGIRQGSTIFMVLDGMRPLLVFRSTETGLMFLRLPFRERLANSGNIGSNRTSAAAARCSKFSNSGEIGSGVIKTAGELVRRLFIYEMVEALHPTVISGA